MCLSLSSRLEDGLTQPNCITEDDGNSHRVINSTGIGIRTDKGYIYFDIIMDVRSINTKRTAFLYGPIYYYQRPEPLPTPW